LGIYFRNKNYDNNLFAFNKIGFVVNVSNKNLFLSGLEINQTNEASDFFDKQIRLYNKERAENEKLNLTRDENLIYAPFISWVYRNESFNKKGEKHENTFGLSGMTEYSKDSLNYKFSGYYSHTFKNTFDFITKIKHKRLEMKKLNPIEESMFSRRRVNLDF